jgi:hypothetical protein
LAAAVNPASPVPVEAGNGLRGRRFTQDLQPIDPAPVLLASDPGSVSSSGSEFFLAYSHQTPLFTSEVVGRRFDAALAPVGAGPITISGSAPDVNHTDPSVVWDGAQWIVSWLTAGTQTARLARVSAAGGVHVPVSGGGGPPPTLILQAVEPGAVPFHFSNAVQLVIGT